jgi:RNA polymerase sigma factor (sigma-70 family)
MEFDEAYKQYFRQVSHFCFRFLGQEEIARDKTQEAFVRLLEMKRKGHEPQHILAWLYKVSGNLCLNHLKKHSRNKAKLMSLGIKIQGPEDPESIYIKTESKDMIRKFIDQLEPRQKMLILGYQDGLSYKELSLMTGISLNSVGKTLWRTINKISDKIKEIEHG